MDPITLATVTSAVVTLALDAAKEVAPIVLKDTWAQVKQWLGFRTEPTSDALAPSIANTLKDDEELAIKIIEAIRKLPSGPSTRLVDRVHVETGQAQVNVTIHGTQTNTFHFGSPKPKRG
jgi:hypothetical protein